MAYETGTSSGIADLFSKVSTFGVANGWTEDHSASDRMFLTRSTVSVGFRWAAVAPTSAGVYQHTAFLNSGTDPGNHTNDSGQGQITTSDITMATGRHVPITDGDMRYWLFEEDTYLHAVVEQAGIGSQRFSHFGMGILTKEGTYTGGEYSYGTRNNAPSGTSASSTYLLDGLLTSRDFAATIRLEGLPNQDGAGKWGLCWAGGTATNSDRGSNARANLQGGFRGGPIARGFGRFGGAPSSGLVNLYSIGAWYDDPSTARWYPLGYQPDVRAINVKNFTGGEEITIGSDTWVVFPTRYKPSVSGTDNTGNSGIAYLKRT